MTLSASVMTAAIEDAELRRRRDGSALEVLRVFLKLGLTSFGGPVAHLGYFRREFVVRRGWLDERAYADLVALCQFLPGPASSQTGFAIGLMRAGYLGGLAAWAGFTLPSAIAMTLFAYGEGALKGPAGDGLMHGLKLVAVAIVAQAVLGMAQSLAPDRPRAAIAVLALILIAFAPAAWAQIAVILLGALAGLIICRQAADVAVGAAETPVSRRMAVVFAAAFFALLALSFAPAQSGATALAAAVLSLGRAGVRRRPCGAAAASGRGGRSRLGLRQLLSGRLRRRPGCAWAALHLRRLSRRGRRRRAGGRRRGGAGAGCDLCARTFAGDGGPSVLERLARPCERARGDGRR